MSDHEEFIAEFLMPFPKDCVITNEDFLAGRYPTITAKHPGEFPDPIDAVDVLAASQRFADRHNPIDAIRSILFAHKIGCYPPLESLNWLCAGLSEWINQDGKKSLDETLGIRKRGRGQRENIQALAAAKKADFHNNLASEMFTLTMLGVSVTTASELIAAIYPIGARTIRDKWAAEWKYNPIGKFLTEYTCGPKTWSDEEKLNYMQNFPDRAKHKKQALIDMGITRDK